MLHTSSLCAAKKHVWLSLRVQFDVVYGGFLPSFPLSKSTFWQSTSPRMGGFVFGPNRLHESRRFLHVKSPPFLWGAALLRCICTDGDDFVYHISRKELCRLRPV